MILVTRLLVTYSGNPQFGLPWLLLEAAHS